MSDASSATTNTSGTNNNSDLNSMATGVNSNASVEDSTFDYTLTPHTAQPTYYNPSLYDEITLTAFNSFLGDSGGYESVTYLSRFGPTFETIYDIDTGAVLGSSSFVNFLGSDVYNGLFVTTNSILVYDNEQISSYYCETLSYQVNIVNLTAALNSVSQTTSGYQTGAGQITITNFQWSWFTTDYGYSGSQILATEQTSASDYLFGTYDTTIQQTAEAVTQVQSLITIQQNNLSTAQTYFNNSVSNLQSQVSLCSQVISSLTSANQAIASNI